uniref:NADH-ubiquinone oxidoreductase chain 6 n=1 Tax=Amphiura sp. JN-2020 TaxID=2763518 RepID=A0A7H0R1L8_9ECHI|nr:NADH dehydrogenase subunit 6 [Amphiura sp. JN-2020]
MVLLLSALISGSVMVLCSRSPTFGIFGVLTQALAFTGLLCIGGASFFGVILVLVYIGGMLIVFLFSTVLSAERYPESGWGEILISCFGLILLSYPFLHDWGSYSIIQPLLPLIYESALGDAFSCFGVFSIVVGLILLVALIVVLFLGFEHSRESLRSLY